MRPLPVTILTGFLGAGKTTLLARLLAEPHGERIAVIVNELGVSGIDPVEQRVQASYLELTEGCVCCVYNPDLVAALDELSARGDVDRVVLETSGLADPLPLTWTLARPDLADRASLDAVVAVVDAVNFQRTLVAEWEAQVSCADLVALSKLDLVDEAGAERARRAVAERNPRARLLDARAPAAGLVLGVAPEERREPLERPVARHSGYGVLSFVDEAAYAAGPLEDLLEDLPAAVFRAKGIVRLDDGRWAAFQAVGGRVQFDPAAPPPPHRTSRFALFGESLRRADLEPLVARCRAPL